MQINIYDAKTQLSQLVERAVGGEEIVIAKNGKPMVKLTPMREHGPRVLGASPEMFQLLEGWEHPLTDEEYDEFTNHGAV